MTEKGTCTELFPQYCGAYNTCKIGTLYNSGLKSINPFMTLNLAAIAKVRCIYVRVSDHDGSVVHETQFFTF